MTSQLPREFRQCGNLLRRAMRPRLEGRPVPGGNGHHAPLQEIDFRSLQRLAANEVAEIGVRLFGRGFQEGTLFRADAHAQYRSRHEWGFHGFCMTIAYEAKRGIPADPRESAGGKT